MKTKPEPKAAALSASQKAAERLAEENAAMKRDAVEQEERLKRLHAKIQKMEQDMAGLLRKRGPVGQGASAVAAKGARDEEVERLEAAIHDRQFHIDAINKQLLIIRHTAPGASRKPLSSIYGAHDKGKSIVSAYEHSAPAKRPRSAAGGKKDTDTALLRDTSEGDLREIISALKRECSSAAERLRAAQKEAEANKEARGGAEQRDKAWESKSLEELRKAVQDLKAKTTMMEATEEQRVLTTKNAKDAIERTEPVVSRLRDEHADLQRKIVDLTHQKKLVELRKGEHDEISAQIVKLRVEQDELEEENRRLRNVAFSASEVVVTMTLSSSFTEP
jgi:DNA repair exonuclease SbcCD ATPase subunit